MWPQHMPFAAPRLYLLGKEGRNVADSDDKIGTLPALTELPEQFRLFRDGKSVAHRYGGDGVFLPIDFPRRFWQETNYDLRYHVFRTEEDRVTVPAVSAIDAITQSGIEKPLKIVRGMAADETIAAVIQAGRLVPEQSEAADEGAQAAEAPAEASGEEPSGNGDQAAEPTEATDENEAAETEAAVEAEPEPAET